MSKKVDFRQKEVINISDGRRLGFISDVDIDLDTGGVKAIIVPGENKLFGIFGGGEDIVIPWENVTKIGIDTILVKLEENNRKKHKEIKQLQRAE